MQLLQGPARETLPCLADADGTLGTEGREKIVKCFSARCANGLDPTVARSRATGSKTSQKLQQSRLNLHFFGEFRRLVSSTHKNA